MVEWKDLNQEQKKRLLKYWKEQKSSTHKGKLKKTENKYKTAQNYYLDRQTKPTEAPEKYYNKHSQERYYYWNYLWIITCNTVMVVAPTSRIEPENNYLFKPWVDKESLFCDTEFLKELIGKEPAKGSECKGDKVEEMCI